jgi:hypothetical protein
MSRKTVRVYEDDYKDLKKIIRELQYDICKECIWTGTQALGSASPDDLPLIHRAQSLVNDALALMPKR